MINFLQSLFGSSWRTSLFACIAVACTAVSTCGLPPIVNKIAITCAAVSTAVGLFLARDNQVTSKDVKSDSGIKS